MSTIFSISISHSNNLTAVLISKGKRVGIDLEFMSGKISKVADKFINNKESITTDPEMNTIVMGIKQMFPSGDDVADWPVIMATAILAMLPPVAVVVFMQKLFIKGLVETEK